MTSIAGFVIVGVHEEEHDDEETVPEVCGIPAHQVQVTELKEFVESSQGVDGWVSAFTR